MAKLVLAIPTLYGDHHTTAVKEILEGLEGLKDIYVSSAFKQISVSYDQKKLSPEQIETALVEAGYSSDEFESAYPTSVKERESRHSAAVIGVGDSLSFAQNVSYEGKALWPCPGFTTHVPAENA
jgi:copper chaperone CopZ